MGDLPEVVPAGSGGARFGVEAGRLEEPGEGGVRWDGAGSEGTQISPPATSGPWKPLPRGQPAYPGAV